MPFLIAAAKGQKQQGINVKIPEIAHYRAIYAIAHNRTNEVVGVLRELINDPNKSINRTARNAIEQAYKHHPVYPEKVDEEYTACQINRLELFMLSERGLRIGSWFINYFLLSTQYIH